MSLTNMLNAAHRRQVHDDVFKECLSADRQVVENILLVLQEYLPLFDISKTTLARASGEYRICVPSSSADGKVLLSNLRDVQAFCPGRIANIEVFVKQDRQFVTLVVHDETKPIPSSQIEIVRMCKKRRL